VIARLDPAGKEVWSSHYGGPSYELANTLAIGPSGHIFLGGGYVGPMSLGGAVLPMSDANDSVYLARFDAGGKHVWSHAYGGALNEDPYDMCVDSAENLFVAGTYEDTIDLGGGPLPKAMSSDGFIAKFGP
jgi:hypothetical protein